MNTVGLRIDVDTLRGTRLGVPRLLQILAVHKVRATFYFSVGPDNMGRHLWRLFRPAFLKKMLRTKAPNLYGWDILLRGTMWPGPNIGKRCADIIRQTRDAGHEIGLHAWDHHAWQMHIEEWDKAMISAHLQRGVDALEHILGSPPSTSAAPGWRCTDAALQAKEQFPFLYNSDCRGTQVFRPLVSDAKISQLQVPTTLPTYDELFSKDDVSDESYNDYLLSLVDPGELNVLTIHAEVEGIAKADLFRAFLSLLERNSIRLTPLADCLQPPPPAIPIHVVSRQTIPGREGWIACPS